MEVVGSTLVTLFVIHISCGNPQWSSYKPTSLLLPYSHWTPPEYYSTLSHPLPIQTSHDLTPQSSLVLLPNEPQFLSDSHPSPQPSPLSSQSSLSSGLPPVASFSVDDPEGFPNNFSFGVASGAYQIEGAWNQDYKGPNIWDHWLHIGGSIYIFDRSNGDYAADAYHHIKEDVEIFNNLTIRHYKFSIPWSRIIPTGCGEINNAAVDHYKHLINLLKRNQIEPLVTIFHDDLPQPLEDQGGILSPFFVDWYLIYVKALFENFGDYVKYWFTFDDPVRTCTRGYGDGTFAPGRREATPFNRYRCGHNILLAHAAAYHMYKECFRSLQQGKISFVIESNWYEPSTNSETDKEASVIKQQFTLGWFMHPIYVGDYPAVMKEKIAAKSQLEGLNVSRLPEFTAAEIDYVKNTHDFFSLNYLASSQKQYVYCSSSFQNDASVEVVVTEEDDTSGLRNLLNWISVNYMYPTILVINGYGSISKSLSDWDRIDYLKRTLKQIRLSQINDNVRIFGFSYYSYIDGFEWTSGYQLKFGLYDVDFECASKKRRPRESAIYYQKVCNTGRI